jgi:hypothetical protein
LHDIECCAVIVAQQKQQRPEIERASARQEKVSDFMLNYLLGRAPADRELHLLVDQLTAANEKMIARAKNAQKVGETLFALIQSEAPSFAIFFEKVQETYVKLSLNYETASKEQGRAIEDLRDVVVRTPVFERIIAEREAAKRTYESTHAKYRDAKLRCRGQPTQESMMAFRNCRIERAQLAELLIAKTETFLTYRTKFTRFVQNRIKSAWERYGKSIERTSRVESELMGHLAEFCKKIRDNVESPHLILQTAEQATTEMKISGEELVGFGEWASPAPLPPPIEEEEEEGEAFTDDLIIVPLPDQ